MKIFRMFCVNKKRRYVICSTQNCINSHGLLKKAAGCENLFESFQIENNNALNSNLIDFEKIYLKKIVKECIDKLNESDDFLYKRKKAVENLRDEIINNRFDFNDLKILSVTAKRIIDENL